MFPSLQGTFFRIILEEKAGKVQAGLSICEYSTICHTLRRI
jgi:hypothetical protein